MKPARQDVYTAIHKAIRMRLAEVGGRLQRADYTATAEVEAVAAEVVQVLDYLEEHGRHEERFIHNHLRGVVPEVVADLEEQHRALDHLAAVLAETLDAARRAEDERRRIAWTVLDRAYSRWFGEQLVHMADEEEQALPALWRHFDDERIAAMRRDIQLDTTPEHYQVWLRWLMRGLSPADVGELLRGARLGAPPALFGRMVAVAEEELGERWPAARARAEV